MSGLYKEGNNYLTNSEKANRLHKAGDNGNRADIILDDTAGVAEVTASSRPQARTAGDTVVYLTGKCDVGAAPIVDMLLGTLPAGFHPHDIVHVGITIESTGMFMRGSVKLSGDQMTFDGTPVMGDIIHFDGATYLSDV